MDCDALIRSNDTYDILTSREALEVIDGTPACMQEIENTFLVEYYERSAVPNLSMETYGYPFIPKCYGLLDTLALEESGILQLQEQPALSLRGQGVFIGFLDTGITYENACFRNTDGTTRIRAIWDQSRPAEEGQTPDGFLYGVEYTDKRINEALLSDAPQSVVPETDENGHGTMLASIACGSADVRTKFCGAAPYAELLVVKLKPAKSYMREFYYIPEDTPVYQENDIMTAIAYLEKTARRFGRPLVICFALGTNNGSHTGAGYLAEYLNDVGGRWRRCIVTATGNEAVSRHHFYGKSDGKETAAVEINVSERMRGFYLEVWARAPEVFSVGVRAPGGAYMPPGGAHEEQEFLFEGTRVEVDYGIVGRTRGDQLVFVRFDTPAAGIWTLYVQPQTTITGNFHVWLPMTGMLSADIVFLRPDPDLTLTVPSTAEIPITVGGYDPENGSIYLNSGRGYTTASVVKPDFCAPAVSVSAVGRLGNAAALTGTSAAAALTAGACAQILEWGSVRGRRLALNSVQIGNLLIRGCVRSGTQTFPNTQWGYGKMNVYQALTELYGI